MAVEREIGSGGLPEDLNVPSEELEQAELDIIEFNKQPNITEFDDGSAVIGEFSEEVEGVSEIPFDGNLAEILDDSVLNVICSDLTGDVEDDLSSRQDWEDTYKTGLELLGMKYEERSQTFCRSFWCYSSFTC